MSDSNARGNEAKCNYKDHLTLCKIRTDCGENQRQLDGKEQNDVNLICHRCYKRITSLQTTANLNYKMKIQLVPRSKHTLSRL